MYIGFGNIRSVAHLKIGFNYYVKTSISLV
jgi:hypothetical protein